MIKALIVKKTLIVISQYKNKLLKEYELFLYLLND